MNLIPLAVALQGIGYGTYLTALQGLWAVTVLPDAATSGGGYMAELPLRMQPRRRLHRGRHWVLPTWEPPPLAPPDEDAEAEREDDEALALACLL